MGVHFTSGGDDSKMKTRERKQIKEQTAIIRELLAACKLAETHCLPIPVLIALRNAIANVPPEYNPPPCQQQLT